MACHLSRTTQPFRHSWRAGIASTSKQGFVTSVPRYAEEAVATSSTSSQQATETPTPAGDERRGRSIMPPYSDWIKRDGKQYEEAPPGRGPFWVASTPFPMNPSFDPPAPISQMQKRLMWKMHLSNEGNTIRVLSSKFGIPMERVHAILRLQALESEWTKKGKALQEPFQKNMERLLGSMEKLDVKATYAERESIAASSSESSRGPVYEEVSLRADAKEDPSIIVPALKKEAEESRARRRQLPTGGPAARGPPTPVKTVKTVEGRAGLMIVDMSSRPSSYIGGGILERNQRRAEKRRQYKAKVREVKEKAAKKAKEENRELRKAFMRQLAEEEEKKEKKEKKEKTSL